MNHSEVSTGHPFVNFVLSAIFMSISVIAQTVSTEQAWRINPGFMDVVQCLAWFCAIGTFCIAVLNYFGIKVFNKKKHGKN